LAKLAQAITLLTSARRAVILIQDFRDFAQLLQAYVFTVLKIRPRLFLSTYFPIPCSLITVVLDATVYELLTDPVLQSHITTALP
jgi:hypothetical protein